MENNGYSPNNKSRREFIKTSIVGSLAALSLPSLSFGDSPGQKKSYDINPAELDE